MHDRAQFWSPVPDWSQARLRAGGIDVLPVNAVAAWLVSGSDVTPLLARAGIGAIHGPQQACHGDRYALRLAPDRVLVVDAASTLDVTAESMPGCALTDISDGIVLFDILGASALEVMAQGSEYRFDDGTERSQESASMNFGGFRVIVSRRERGWRLHVERPWAAGLWRWLEARIAWKTFSMSGSKALRLDRGGPGERVQSKTAASATPIPSPAALRASTSPTRGEVDSWRSTLVRQGIS